MSTIICKKQSSFDLLIALKKAGRMTLHELSEITGLSQSHCAGNIKSYISRGRVRVERKNNCRGRNTYWWIGGDSDIIALSDVKKTNTDKRTCACGKRAYRIKWGTPVCLRCDTIESSIYGHRITKFSNRSRIYQDDQSLMKYITVYEMPATYTP